MLLTEVLVAIAVVAQAKHRHHEKKRDQAGRRENNSTVTALQFSATRQTLLLLSPVTTEDLEIVLIVLLWRSILPAWLTSTLHSSRQLVKGALSEKEPIRSSYSRK